MNESTPPQRPTSVEMIRASAEYQNRSEPHIIFIPHNISRMMKDQLESEGRTVHQFMTDLCKSYLADKLKEKEEITKYIAFSEMQLFESKL